MKKYEHLGKAIRKARKKANILRGTFARHLGIKLSELKAIEAGRSKLPVWLYGKVMSLQYFVEDPQRWERALELDEAGHGSLARPEAVDTTPNVVTLDKREVFGE